MNYKENLKIDMQLPLLAKIELSKIIIKQYYETKNGKIYVAFSGGKDSTVLLHIVRSIYPDALAVFCNTTNEKPEIYEYVKNTQNVKWLLPKKGLNWIIKKYGFPMISKKVCKQVNTLKNPTDDNKNLTNLFLNGFTQKGKYLYKEKMSEIWKPLVNEPFDISSKCCEILKHEPARRFDAETGMSAMSGIMASESDTRKTEIERSGYVIDTVARPLAFWNEEDVWEYAKLNNIRFAENYYDRYVNGQFVTADKRSGCDKCLMGFKFEITKKRQQDMFYQNRLQKSQICDPKGFEKIMNTKNNGVTFRKAIKTVFKYEV